MHTTATRASPERLRAECISVTFIRRAGIYSVGLAHKWESACQACANSTLRVTLAPPGANTVPFSASQLSAVNRVGWWSTGISLANVPLSVPVTLTVKAASAVAGGDHDRVLPHRSPAAQLSLTSE